MTLADDIARRARENAEKARASNAERAKNLRTGAANLRARADAITDEEETSAALIRNVAKRAARYARAEPETHDSRARASTHASRAHRMLAYDREYLRRLARDMESQAYLLDPKNEGV